MRPRKKIEIKSQESQKSYLDDINPNPGVNKSRQVRKSCLIRKDINEKMQAYIYQKRTHGDIYYTQTDLIEEALERFLSAGK